MNFWLRLVLLLLFTIIIGELCNWLRFSRYSNCISEIFLGIVLFTVWMFFLSYHLIYYPWLEANSWRPCFEDHLSITTMEISMIDDEGNSPYGDNLYIQKENCNNGTYMFWYITENDGSPEKKEIPVSLTEIVYISQEETPRLQITISRKNCSYNTLTETHRLGKLQYSYVLYIHGGCIIETYKH